MKYVTSHIMGIRLQAYKLLGRPYTPVTNTTLNELFSVQSGVVAPNGATPNMQYLAIGNGGHIEAATGDGFSYPQLVNHGPRDCALINHIPFVLRLVTDDLTASEQAKYGLRVPQTYNGANYIAYYLRVIDLSTVNIDLLQNTVQSGNVTSTPWVPTTANLHPTPVLPSSTGVVVASGDYVSVQAILNATLNTADISELMNVAQVLFGTTDAAIISESALVAGTPMVVSAAQSGGGTLNYTEVVGAIICSSLSRFYHLPSLNQTISLNFDVGGAESLYGVDDGVGVA